ncbi:DNA polymerase III, beta subunit [Quadrisphaera granulorum]|uniref:Beta sliding clamp n=1 Tax=Quadrisphaera granulorum TaxID=317664 RepID=A0A316AEH1_9ACTN|nr:DNA polymerase III subunit beta [Quadrisphaera granulorum]PWJ55759.1 DNA polymerase III beta subunit [Quadrisphaera granulorum]SZE95256.1 DNA polymerase III, beta subunit [Quadrisphaera granulorum]
MRFGVERDVLADAVGWTARTLPARPPVPVLSGVLLEATEPGVLKLSSFDYEVSAHVEVSAEVHEPGRVLVSGRLLADIARSLPGQPVQVSLQGPRVVVTCGSSRFTLLTMPVDDYPTLPAMPDVLGSVAGDVFASAVAQVVVAASRDETLPVLTGVRVEIEGDELTLLATDRYRLAVRTLPWSAGSGGASSSALVRARTLSEVARAMGSGEVVVALSPDAAVEGRGRGGSGLVGFEAGGRRTTSLLVDGDYPKVRSLFPAESPISAVVSVPALVEAVRRVALVAERSRPVRLSFTEGQVVLEAGDGEDAQASEAITAQLHGDDVTIAFNPQFLLDGLLALSTPYVRLSFTVPTKPAVLTGQLEEDGDSSDHYRYLLMPVRLAG